MEERRKNDPVHCPVCRALWPYHMTSPSGHLALDVMPVTVPFTSEGGVARNLQLSTSSSGGLILSHDKLELLERLKKVCHMTCHTICHMI